jgi:hypothetical protein
MFTSTGSWQEFITRTSICVIGTCFGVLMIPSIGIIFMEGDGPHAMTMTMATMGLIGSVLLFIGGIVGAYMKRWITLLPGTILIMICLATSMSKPTLWVVVVLAILVLLHCLKSFKHDPNVEHSNLMEDFDRCFDVDDSCTNVV